MRTIPSAIPGNQTCPVCDGRQFGVAVQEADHHFLRCDRCGFVFILPRPAAAILAEISAGRFRPHDPVSLVGRIARDDFRREFLVRHRGRARNRRKMLEVLTPSQGPKHLLDVGCGVGEFLEVFGDAPEWTVSGREPNADVVEAARWGTGLPIEVGFLDDGALSQHGEESLDVVTLWDFLEYLPDPRKTLQVARMMLREGGVFACSIHNVDSLQARLRGARWNHLTSRHPNHFNQRNLAVILRQEGLEPVAIRTAHAFSFTWTLREHLWEARGIPLAVRARLSSLLAAVKRQAIYRVPNLLLRHTAHGTHLDIYAIKLGGTNGVQNA